MSDLAAAADVVLPGASWLEEDASYVNGEGRLQAAARAIPPPGEAQEDWQIFVNLGLALGASVTYASSTEVRAALAQAMSGNPTYAGLATMGFARPVSARHWLQASNPSERWKWDFMFQDLPPVKFEITPRAAAQSLKIPLQKVD
jgi:predicted molibdopterin-dependent oxidoreductase YjgC